MNEKKPLRVNLVGHPFNPIGTGRALRLVLTACRSVGLETTVRDVWEFQEPEAAQAKTILPLLTKGYGEVNVFHLNGNEIEPALERIGPLPDGFNVIAPFWELSQYPAGWARQIEQFDEVWAASKFIQDSISSAVSRSVIHMPLPTEITLPSFLGRRYYGIPESSYTFLVFFDCKSYIMRKNPQAVVECFRRLLDKRPWARTSLVVKLHGAEAAPAELQTFLAGLNDLRGRVVVLNCTMTEVEIHNLIRCCDAFVSLHRSEGYGLGLAEAMYLGLPAVGTGYSGNMDFMTPDNSFPISYQLVPVPAGGYPYSEGQHWAEPDLDEALACMIKLLDHPAEGRALGVRASRSMRVNFSSRAAGLRYANRVSHIREATYA
jgi:glycosyltransferase involved in cell wall biosynthesis